MAQAHANRMAYTYPPPHPPPQKNLKTHMEAAKMESPAFEREHHFFRNFHFGAPAVSCEPCPSMCDWNMPEYMHMCNQCVYVYLYIYKWYMYVPFCKTCILILSMWIDAWANSKYFHNQLLKPDVVWGWCNSARKTAVYKWMYEYISRYTNQ